MALPKVLANFTTSLATKISSSASSLTLSRSTDPDGTTLSGQYILTLDEGTSVEEHMLVTLAGSAGTIDTRGLSKVDMSTSVAGNKFAHDRGAEIKVTNAVLVRVISELNGSTRNNVATGTSGLLWRVGAGTDTDIFFYAQNADASKPFIKYDSTTNKWLISNDGTNSYDPQAGGSGVTAGAGIQITAGVVSTKLNASGLLVENLGAGTDELGIATDTANALAGTSGTPSTSNKFVTDADTTATATASKVARFKSNTKIDDAALALTTAGDLPYSDGTDMQRLAIGTAGQTLRVNSGATAPTWQSTVLSRFTDNVTTSGTSDTTLFSFTVPGGTLGTTGIIKVKMFVGVSLSGAASGGNFYLKYGATTIATFSFSRTNSGSVECLLEANIFAAGATNSQEGDIVVGTATQANDMSSTGVFFFGSGRGTAAEDSTTNKTLTISAALTSGANNITAYHGYAIIL